MQQNHLVEFIKIPIPRPLLRSFDAKSLQRALVLLTFNKQPGDSDAAAHEQLFENINVIQPPHFTDRLRPREREMLRVRRKLSQYWRPIFQPLVLIPTTSPG